MATRDVVTLNETASRLEVAQAGDTYNLPRDTNVAGNLTVAGNQILGGVARNTWPAAGNATQTLTDVLTNGEKGNLPAAGAFELRNSTGATTHFAVDEATGKVTKINLDSMLGNISDPLTHIPFRRVNDEVRLSGTQTITHASTGTYIDPLDGLLKTAAIDTPRFERMSDGGIGLLLERASTNDALHSDDLTNATAWVLASGTTAKDATGPDGVANSASSFTATAANAVCMQTITNASQTRTYSVRLKRRTGTGSISITIDGGATWIDVTASVTSTEWTQFKTTQTVTNAQFGIRLGYQWDVVEVASNQNEALPFATSYIPTTTAAVTRAADNLNTPASGNITDKFTVIIDAEVPLNSGPNVRLFGVDGSGLYIRTYQGGYAVGTTGVNSLVFYIPSSVYGSTHRFAFVFDNANSYGAIYVDGVLQVENNALVDNVSLNSSALIKFNNYGSAGDGNKTRNFRIYDRALTASEIAAA